MTARTYIDANILIYCVEGPPPLKAKAEGLFDGHLAGGAILATSVLTIGECLRGAARQGRDWEAAYRDLFASDALLLEPVNRGSS